MDVRGIRARFPILRRTSEPLATRFSMVRLEQLSNAPACL